MRYIIELPDDFAEATKEYWDKTVGLQLEPYTEDDRKSIEDEVWELADYMGRMSLTERDLCFGFPLPQEVTANLTYQEAKTLFEKWMKSENEIHVGDEVYPVNPKAPRVVTKIENRVAYQMGYDGNMWADDVSDLHKTGRHFPEVGQMLEKMRGDM